MNLHAQSSLFHLTRVNVLCVCNIKGQSLRSRIAQGGLLTGVLFILQVNKAGRPCPAPRQEDALTPTEEALTPTEYTIQQLDVPGLREEDTILPIEYHPHTSQSPAPRQQDYITPLCHQSKKPNKKMVIDDLTLLEKYSL